jgi:CRISPR-associated protein Csm1
MSLQVFLQAKFFGINALLTEEGLGGEAFLSRCHWFSLLGEMAPRALLAELGLSPLLLGAATGGRFLLVLPEASIPAAEAFLSTLAERVSTVTNGRTGLIWATTENLGAWPDIRKRLENGLRQRRDTPRLPLGLLAGGATPFPYDTLAASFRPAANVGWSPEDPTAFLPDVGTHQWPLPIAVSPTVPPARRWGVLTADLDNVGPRLQAATTAEEYLQLSMTFKNFVAGELARVAATAEFASRVTVLYSGGDDFAVAAPWDALLDLAREMRRVAGLMLRQLDEQREGASRSVSMAIVHARRGESLAEVYSRSLEALEAVKASGKNAISLFGRTLDWAQLKEAVEIKGQMRKLLSRFHASPEFLDELEGFYLDPAGGADLASARSRRRGRTLDKPWRLHRRLRRAVDVRESDAFDKQWDTLLSQLTAEAAGRRQLRPTGYVALAWARLEATSS